MSIRLFNDNKKRQKMFKKNKEPHAIKHGVPKIVVMRSLYVLKTSLQEGILL